MVNSIVMFMKQENSNKLSEEIKNHLNKYWNLSQEFFERCDFALASFFAITLIEEVGKLSIIRIENMGGQVKNKIFYNHEKKYFLAVMDNLFENSRVTRIYGKNENKFAEWYKNRNLFKMRNNSVYLERDLSVPETKVSEYESCLLVCIAGEIYAEAQGESIGTDAEESIRITDEVDVFRKSHEEILKINEND